MRRKLWLGCGLLLSFALVLAASCAFFSLGGSAPAPTSVPPPPDPQPESSLGPSIDARLRKLDLHWNAWAEPGTIPTYQPLESLQVGREASLFLHLATVLYGRTGLTSVEAGAELRDELGKALADERTELLLDIVPLTDSALLEVLGPHSQTITIRLDRLRKLVRDENDPAFTPGVDPMRVLASKEDSEFVLARTALRVRPKAAGTAMLVLSLWSQQRRPVQQLRIPLCIADEGQEDACSRAEPALRQMLSSGQLASALGGEEVPAGALHFVEAQPGGHLYGVFTRREWQPGTFARWRLDDGEQGFRLQLARYSDFFGPGVSDEERLARGRELFSYLFANDGSHAFQDFATEVLLKATQAPDQPPPRLVVNASFAGPSAPLFIPLGIAALQLSDAQSEHLGYFFRIETPLPTSRPVLPSSGACLRRWAAAMPPNNEASDAALHEALTALGHERVELWEASGLVHRSIGGFRSFVEDRDEPAEDWALVLLAHHSAGRFRFNNSEVMSAYAIQRRFSRKSVVILNACGTGAADTTEFIRNFDRRGIESVIATAAEVNPVLAGRFLAQLDDRIRATASEPDEARPVLEDVFFETLQCLSGRKPCEETTSFGGQALNYLLLGRGDVKLCEAKR